MLARGITLRALELIEALARHGNAGCGGTHRLAVRARRTGRRGRAEIARSLRAMMAARLIGPAGRLMPWLGANFAVIAG